MNVLTEKTSFKSRIPYEGAHELSWNHMLDIIYSHAMQNNIGTLYFSLGEPALESSIRLRSDTVSMNLEGMDRTGVAVVKLVSKESSYDQLTMNRADVVYTVEYGSMAPRGLRRFNPSPPSHGQLWKSVSIYTWRAKMFGVPIRLANVFKRPYAFDRFMRRMRRVFLSDGHTPAYYHLKIWNTESGV